jgi:membrane protein implicated in regulation of membrane protease activity
VGSLANLFAEHAIWAWLALGAVFLMIELVTGSGWMLWPAAAAAGVGILTGASHLAPAGQAVAFAITTVLATYLGRRFLGRPIARQEPDINDPVARLIGHHGEAACAFNGGRGRVFVDGKEWSAELDDAADLSSGARIEVVAVKGGAHLKVRSA